MDEQQLLERIKEITAIQATSGHEEPMRRYMAEHMRPYVDEIQYDGLGGVFGIKKCRDEQAKTVMIASHMDEVGFMVAAIRDNGSLKVVPLGGWNANVVSAQRFTLQTQKGDMPVISSSIPPHLLRGTQQNGSIDVSEILFDAGFSSKEEAMEYGVRPGDTIVPESEAILTANKKNVIAKAWDNRYGCLLILMLLEELKDVELSVNLVVGANVQEEVGLRGAPVSAHMFQPDLFFAVDCSAANDIQTKTDTFGHLGEGFLVRIQDPRFIMLPRMRQYIIDIAEQHHIPYQYYVSKGGTDAAEVHKANNGIPSAVIGVVARYIHTHQSMFSIDDFLAAKDEMSAIIRDLNTDKVQTLIYGEEV